MAPRGKHGGRRAGAHQGDGSKKSRAGDPNAAASSPASGDAQTEGERQLAAVRGSLSEIADQLGVAKQMVSCWRRGSKKPGSANRKKIERAFGIPAAAWDQRPGGGARRTKTKRAPVASARPKPEPMRPVGERPSTLEETNELLDILRVELEQDDLTPIARQRLIDSRTKALTLKARIEKDAELLEDRVVREHPMWQRIRDLIVDFTERLSAKDAREFAARLAELEAEG